MPEQLSKARQELDRQEQNLAGGKETLSTLLQLMGYSGDLEKDWETLSGNSQYQDLLRQVKTA